jgi:hypothetical protein
MDGLKTLVRFLWGEEGRLGGSWMMLRAGVVLPSSSILAVRGVFWLSGEAARVWHA